MAMLDTVLKVGDLRLHSMALTALALMAASPVVNALVVSTQVTTRQLLTSYDYIIIGGGTAGLTVADRLTEDAAINVLVLEAGSWGDADEVLSVNLASGGLSISNSSNFWPNLYSVPQVNLGNRIATILIGKIVGGGSAVNAMFNMRGAAEDYERWEQLFETGGQNSTVRWGWEGLLPFFKKGLHFTPPPSELTENFDSIKYDASYWGNSSDIYAGWPTFYWPSVRPLLDALHEIKGVLFPPDSGAGQAGVYWFPSLVDPRSYTRSYAGTGHYENINAMRPNYHLLTNTQARRILVNDELVATGVEFPSGNSSVIVEADREVILAAGAIHTPHLLQLSGIGPRNILEAARIKVLVDLPGVGQNFQDHTGLADSVNITLRGLDSIHPNPNDLTPGSAFQNWTDQVWAANRTGPKTIASTNLAAWLPLTVISENADALATRLEQLDYASLLPVDAHATVIAGYAAQMRILATQMRSPGTAWMRMRLDPDYGTEGPVLMQSMSRGTVNINSTDPWNTEPVVDYRALTNTVEVDVHVEFIKFVRRYAFNTSLALEFAPIDYSPGPDVTSDEDLRTYVAEYLSTNDVHPVGTASMLPLELGGVVDRTLRVYGVKSLRVVDASIMSMLPGANTCQPVYAIAEKASDIIKSGV